MHLCLQPPSAAQQRQFSAEYLRPVSAELKELFVRFMLLYWRNKFMLYARIFQVCLL